MADRTATLTAIMHDGVSGPAKKISAEITGLGSGVSKLGSVLQGIGVGIGVALFQTLEAGISRLITLIPDLIGKAVAFGQNVNDLQNKTGGSAEAASRLIGIFKFLGVETEGLGSKVAVLAKHIIAQPDLLRKYGIATTDAAGRQLDMLTIIDNARQALDRLGPGYERTAASSLLFGRTGAGLIEYFALTTPQVRLLEREMDRLGVTIDEQGIFKAEDAGRSFNLLGLAIQGVANRLLSDIAPAIMGAVDAIAGFVETNGQAIADFAGSVVNYVFGMIQALTGVSLAGGTFVDSIRLLDSAVTPAQGQIAALKDQLTALDGAHTKAASSSGGMRTATDAETAAIDRQLGALHSQLAAIDAKEAKQQSLEDQARRARELAGAEADLVKAMAGGDSAAIADARQRVSDIIQQQRDAAMRATDDVKRAKIQAEEEALQKRKQAVSAERTGGAGSAGAQAEAEYQAKRKAILAQIALLEAQDKADAKAKTNERARMNDERHFGEQTANGLSQAMNSARDAGVRFANEVKTALAGLGDSVKALGAAFQFLNDWVITPLYHVLADMYWLAQQVTNVLGALSLGKTPATATPTGPRTSSGDFGPSRLTPAATTAAPTKYQLITPQNLAVTLQIDGKQFKTYVTKVVADEERRYVGGGDHTAGR
jgi:hypothetical protein